jgi:peptidoglycan/xylan/chitin deacetylase (PgdA/CDA1 family)
MRKRILTCIAACFYYSGLVKLARLAARYSGPRLIILNYHRATGGDLRRQLLYLRRHYRILPLEQALEELFTDVKGGQHQPRDQRIPLVLTFDDGYRDNYTHGLALARELQIPITIFLIPGYIESENAFWWLESGRLVRLATVDEVILEDRTYHLGREQERKSLAQVIDGRLRYATSVAERDAFLAIARKLLGVSSTATPEEKPSLSLTWAEVREMQESGYVSFGAHTMDHPLLAYLTDPNEIEYQISTCRRVLEQQMGRPVRAFAYPVGQLQHIGDTIQHAVQRAGYDWALTTLYGANTPKSNPYLLRRIEADVSQHWLVVAAEAAGLWGFFSRLRWNPRIRKSLTNAGQIRGL